MGIGGFIKEFLPALVADLLARKINGGQSSPKQANEKPEIFLGKLITSKFLGLGKNDEVLLNNAYLIATCILTRRKEENALKMLNDLPRIFNKNFKEKADARSFRQIFGHEKITLPEEIQKNTGMTIGNWEGALSLCMLSRMKEKEIIAYLKSIGTFDTLTEILQSYGQTIKTIAKDMGIEKAWEKLKAFDASQAEKADEEEGKYRKAKALREEKKARKIPFLKKWWIYAAIIFAAALIVIDSKGIGKLNQENSNQQIQIQFR
jgi:hypothetical protein